MRRTMKKSAEMEISAQNLRAVAEKKLAETPDAPPETEVITRERLIHELQVHQVELEMQNEELKRVQLALEESRDKYLDLYDFAPIGYLTFTGKGIVTEANLAGAALLGVERKKLLNRGLGRFIVHDDLDKWDRHIANVQGHEERQSCELLLKREDGSTFHAHLESILMKAGDGNHLIRSALSDITERKRSEKELLIAKETAEAASRAKSDFLANMSHELRTPLTAILGFSEILRGDRECEISDKQKEYIANIWTCGKHLHRLINDMLDFSRIAAGKIELELKEFYLPEIIRNSLAMLEEKAMKHGIKITADIEEGIGNITADEIKLKQVLLNLLSNAVKFTPDGGSVSVKVRSVPEVGLSHWGAYEEGRGSTPPQQSGHFVEFCVEDTGIGISPDDQKRLFQPFQQIESYLTKKYEGIGLGLILSKKMVELHGGSIWVESEAGKGSRFCFMIPVAHPQYRGNKR